MVNLEMSRTRNWARISTMELQLMSFIPQITHLMVNPVIIYIYVHFKTRVVLCTPDILYVYLYMIICYAFRAVTT